MFVDSIYYKTNYKGTLIPDDSFAEFEERASEFIVGYVMQQIDVDNPHEEVKKCTCRLAEILYNDVNPKIASETVGPHSTQYAQNMQNEKLKSLESRMVFQIRLYLGKTGLLSLVVN